ncbi:MAG: hypothetical protein ACXWV9_01565 [Flavisolibacter sp.]
MKHIAFIFFAFIFYKPILSQNIVNSDSCDTNSKFYQGTFDENILESGKYIYTISKHYSFIEITFTEWKSIHIKYRVEKLLNGQIFSVTKTSSNDYNSSNSKAYNAIDSTTFNTTKKTKKYFNYLKKEKICEELTERDLEILHIFSRLIIKHNLQTEFSNFQPKLFVAWLKVKVNLRSS